MADSESVLTSFLWAAFGPKQRREYVTDTRKDVIMKGNSDPVVH